jgi:hypothetical protein
VKLLVISYQYAPAVSPRAFRWTALCEYWAAQGWDVSVVTGPVGDAAAIEVLAGVQIRRVGAAFLERLRASAGLVTAPSECAAPQRWSIRRAAVRTAKRLHDSTWRRIYWPDYACLWYPAALREVRAQLAGQSFDAVVSVSLPFTAHLVALSAGLAARRIPWVMDVGDPFASMHRTPTNNQALYGRLNRSVEARAIREARAVSVTTPELRAEYLRAHPLSAEHVVVIPPLYAVPAGGTGAPFWTEDPGVLRLVYLGTLYPTIRAPDFLLALFRRLLDANLGRRLELHFIGDHSMCADSFAPYADLRDRQLFLHGLVDRSRAMAALTQGDILVNIGNVTANQVPSKLVEYLGTGAPILNVTSGPTDSSIPVLSRHPNVLHLSGTADPSAEIEAVKTFVRRVAAEPQRADGEELTRPFHIDRVASAYEGLLTLESSAAPR